MASGSAGRRGVSVLAWGAAAVAASAGGASAQQESFLPINPALPGLLAQNAPVVACFAPGTDLGYIRAVTSFLNQRNQQLFGGVADFHLGTRWPGTMGTPVALTWSLVPDGVVVMGGQGESNTPSELFAQMDAAFAQQGGRATWVMRIQQSFDRWAQLTGVTFTRVRYNNNDWDDGGTWGAAGQAGFRGDMRISMHPIDGASNVLAYCYYPNSGDMVIDSDDVPSFANGVNQHRFFRNCITHEMGHGLGLGHTCPDNDTKIMEPLISINFDGPRQDDIRGVNSQYGDPFESNNTPATARALGALISGTPLSIGVPPAPPTGTSDSNSAVCSIDAAGAVDYYSFTTGGPTTITATVTPVGSVYDSSDQNPDGSCASGSNVNGSTAADLVLTVYSTNGTTSLASANAHPAGMAEVISNLALPSAGMYYVKVSAASAPTPPQLYRLDVTGQCASSPTFVVQPSSRLVLNGANVMLSAMASNATAYRWRHNNIPMSDGGRFSGTATPNLSITVAHQSDGGTYTLVATGGCASTTSQPALLTIQCYPNCDNSTSTPVLTVNDFQCFITKFTAGDTYANCDGSTLPPILNLFDFICFQQKFAAGCL